MPVLSKDRQYIEPHIAPAINNIDYAVHVPSLNNVFGSRVGNHTNLVHVVVQNFKIKALVDTGATISCISSSLVQNLSLPSIEPSSIKSVMGVGNQTHNITGCVTLSLKFCDAVTLDHKFHVISGNQPLILGMDFLKSHKCQVHLDSSSIIMYGWTFPLVDPISCALAAKTVRLLPQSIYAIPVHLPPDLQHGCTVLLDSVSLEHISSSLKVTPIIDTVGSDKDMSFCRIVNNSTSPIVVSQGTALARVSVINIDSLQSVSQETPQDFIANLSKACAEPAPTEVTEAVQVCGQTDNELDVNMDLSLTKVQSQQLLDLLSSNRKCFATNTSELGLTNLTKHSIDTGCSKPIRQRSFRFSPKTREKLDAILDDMYIHGLIEPSTSQWCSPCFLVKKADGSDRLVVDFRSLNKVTNPTTFPMPQMETILDALGDQKPTIFSTLDLAAGFHQIPLDSSSKHKTSFATMNRQFQYKVMPMGLAGSPITFQALMVNKVLPDLLFKNVIVYADDIIVYSKDFDTHLQDLQQVFDRLQHAQLTLKPNKCHFAQQSVLYLGHIISAEGIRPNPAKTSVIDNYPRPKDNKHVRKFLGLTNYYRRFVKDYSSITAPLRIFTQKDVPLIWTPECEAAFQLLKSKLVSPPILRYPDQTQPFILTTDASKTGISYILSQKDREGREYVCYYGARSLRGSEKNYGSTDLEALAVVEGVQTYHTYLIDKKFTIITDHAALKYLDSAKFRGDSGRMARWAQRLMQYDYTVQYKQGKKNVNADTLSRIDYNSTEPVKQAKPTEESNNTFVPETAQVQVIQETKPKYSYHFEYEQLFNTVPFEEGHVYACVDDPKESNPKPIPQLELDDSLAESQKMCPEIGPIYNYIQSDILPEDTDMARRLAAEKDSYVIIDNKLYHLFSRRLRSAAQQDRYIQQLVIPKSSRTDILEHYHDSLMGGGHQGFDRTYNAIKTHYYWPKMYNHILDYIRGCTVCQQSKRAYHVLPPPLHPLPIADTFERWHIDFLGSITESAEGFTNILVISDSGSKWIEAFPTKTQTAEEVAKILYREIFTRYGAPRTLISDRGKCFMATLTKALCEIFSIKLSHTSPYHPQTNSTVERMNSYLEQSLRAYCDKDHSNWPDVLPGILMAYRCTPATQSTDYAPYYLVFGRDMRRPIDINLTPKANLSASAKTNLTQFLENLKVSRTIAKENMQRHKDYSKQLHDKKSAEPQFKIGQKVRLKNHLKIKGKSPKLCPQWMLDYRIIEEGPNFTYKLQNEQSGKVTSFINASQIQEQHTRSTPEEEVPTTEEADDTATPSSDSESEDNTDENNATDKEDSSQSDKGKWVTIASGRSYNEDGPRRRWEVKRYISPEPAEKPDSTASKTDNTIIKIKRYTWYKGKKWYHVHRKDQKRISFAFQDEIPEKLIEDFHANFNSDGKKRKRKLFKPP